MTGAILTAIGKAKIASATPEDQLQITHVAVGDGNGSYPVLTEDMIALTNEVWRGDSSNPIRDAAATNTLMFESAIPPDVGGFTIREIAIFDVDGDMIAIGHVNPAQIKPLPTSETAVNMTVRMIIALANAEQTNLVLQVAPLVTHNSLSDREVKGAHPDSAIVTWSGRSQEDVNKRRFYIEDFGGVGDGVFDNKDAFNRAFSELSNGDVVWLRNGAEYFVSSVDTIEKSISIKCDGRAKVTHDNPNTTGILYDIAPTTTTSVITPQYIYSRKWRLASVEGINVGDLMVVMSSASWYFDPRPESTDARKSEVHRVMIVNPSDNTIETEIESNDGYDESESVTVTFYRPITATVENIDFLNKQRGNKQGSGIRFKRGYRCYIKNCSVKDYGLIPTGFEECYESYVVSNKISGATADATYATKMNGCTLCFAVNNTYSANYAALDISGNHIISMLCGAIGNTCNAGDYDASGGALGWIDGVRGSAPARGFGTHAPADKCYFYRNKVLDCANSGFVLRGRNHIVDSNILSGRMSEGCIRFYDGVGGKVTNNTIDLSIHSGKTMTLASGTANSNRYYPFSFIRVLTNYYTDRYNPLIIKGNTVSISGCFLDCGGDSLADANYIKIIDNDITLIHPTSTTIMNVVYRRPLNVNDVVLTEGFFYKGNTVTCTSPLGFNLFSEGVHITKGVYIESSVGNECSSVTLSNTVTWENPNLSKAILKFDGYNARVDFSVSGGSINAAVGSAFSIDFNVPFLDTSYTGSSNAIGSIGSTDAIGVVSYSLPTTSIRLLAKRFDAEVTPLIRGNFVYPIGS